MALYESYLDEDVDYLADLYEDFDEDYDESDFDYGEARRSNRRRNRRQQRGLGRGGRGRQSRVQSRGSQDRVGSSEVRKAFQEVGKDVDVIERKLKITQTKQSAEQINDALTLLAFRPRPITAQLPTDDSGSTDVVVLRDKDGNIIPSITTGLEDNVLPLILVKILGNAGGQIQKYLPFFLAALILYPDLLKNLNLNGIGQNRTTTATTSTSSSSGSGIDPGLLLLLGAVFLLGKR